MNNPLLQNSVLPLFSQIKTEHVEPAIDQLLAKARTVVEQHLQAPAECTWENLVEPMKDILVVILDPNNQMAIIAIMALYTAIKALKSKR